MVYSSGLKMELDVYIEDLKLAFEYQGEQHYKPIYCTGRNFEQQQRRDAEKHKACKQVLGITWQRLILQNNITLIEVPYWWDRDSDSLAATIHEVRSELISAPPAAEPITLHCPTDIGVMVAPLSHGFSWDKDDDVTGW